MAAEWLKAADFARGRAFSASTLRWWSSRLGRDARTARATGFAKLVPTATTAKAAELGNRPDLAV